MNTATIISLPEKQIHRKFGFSKSGIIGNMKKWALHFKKNVSSLSLYEAMDFYAHPKVLICQNGILPEIVEVWSVTKHSDTKYMWGGEWEEVPLSDAKLVLRDLEDISIDEYNEFKRIGFDPKNKRRFIGNPDGFAFLIKMKFDLFTLIPRGLAVTEEQANIIISSAQKGTSLVKKNIKPL